MLNLILKKDDLKQEQGHKEYGDDRSAWTTCKAGDQILEGPPVDVDLYSL